MTVTITQKLGSLWATPEQLAEMSDEEIVEMIQEDLLEFVDGATWSVER